MSTGAPLGKQVISRLNDITTVIRCRGKRDLDLFLKEQKTIVRTRGKVWLGLDALCLGLAISGFVFVVGVGGAAVLDSVEGRAPKATVMQEAPSLATGAVVTLGQVVAIRVVGSGNMRGDRQDQISQSLKHAFPSSGGVQPQAVASNEVYIRTAEDRNVLVSVVQHAGQTALDVGDEVKITTENGKSYISPVAFAVSASTNTVNQTPLQRKLR